MSAMAFAGASAFMQMKASQAQARGLQQQAAFARIQTRQEALKYKAQGVAILDNILQTQSLINARAGAGNIDPLSGSAGQLQMLAEAGGAKELLTNVGNKTIALAAGEMQAQQYGLQSTAARQAGFAAAIGTLGQGYMTGKAIR